MGQEGGELAPGGLKKRRHYLCVVSETSQIKTRDNENVKISRPGSFNKSVHFYLTRSNKTLVVLFWFDGGGLQDCLFSSRWL